MTAIERPSHSEIARQLVHITMGGFALLLRWLTWSQALALAVAALVFNVFVLPRFGSRLYRRPGGVIDGIVFYPVSVLLLIVSFPHRPSIVAAAWGVLAAGDGVATIAGRLIGGPRWPWNREKTAAGSVAFAIGGAAAGAALAVWCADADAQPLPAFFLVAGSVAAAIVAAAVETIPVRLDDNLSVAIAAGATLWVVSLIAASGGAGVAGGTIGPIPIAALVNGAAAGAGYAARTVTVAGALGGFVIGTIIYVAMGWQGWVLLFATFMVASAASKVGLRRKVLLGIAEERGGRRGAGNAIANTGVAAVAGLLVAASAHVEAARWAFAAALAAGGSDTVASEIGKAWGRRTWSVTTFRRVPPGTSGAMSAEGTAAGVAAALALGAFAVALGLAPSAALIPIVLAATAGSLVESGLGATLEPPGILNNDMLNFVNTAVAALIAAAWSAHA